LRDLQLAAVLMQILTSPFPAAKKMPKKGKGKNGLCLDLFAEERAYDKNTKF